MILRIANAIITPLTVYAGYKLSVGFWTAFEHMQQSGFNEQYFQTNKELIMAVDIFTISALLTFLTTGSWTWLASQMMSFIPLMGMRAIKWKR